MPANVNVSRQPIPHQRLHLKRAMSAEVESRAAAMPNFPMVVAYTSSFCCSCVGSLSVRGWRGAVGVGCPPH